MVVSQFAPAISEAKSIWITHLNSPNSMFYKGHRTERCIKRLFPKLRLEKSLSIIKIVKLEALKLLNSNRFGVYLSLDYLAEQIKTTRSGASQILHKLENLEIIELIPVAIPNKSKASRNKLLIVPNKKLEQSLGDSTVALTDLQFKLSTLQFNLSTLQFNLFSDLITKSTTYKDHFRLLFRMLLRINIYIDSKESIKISSRPEKAITGTNSLLKEKPVKGTFERHTLQRTSKTNPLFTRFKLLRKSKGKYIVKYSDYGLRPTDFMNNIDSQENVCRCLEQLIENNVEPKLRETKEILSVWNSIDDRRFSKIKPKINSKTFMMAQILVTHHLHFKNLQVDDIKDAIKIFKRISNTNQLKYKKKLNMLFTFLWNSKQYTSKKWFDVCLMSEKDALAFIYGNKPKFEKTFDERLTKLLIDHFYPNASKAGREAIRENYTTLIEFSDKMVDWHKTMDMCNLSMYGFINQYFGYLKKRFENIDNFVFSIRMITNFKWVSEFIMNRRMEPGWSKFGEDLKN